MSKLPLTVATWRYDRVRALRDGTVPIDGCDPNYLNIDLEDIFFRAFRHAAFDVSEMSFSTYLLSLGRERDLGVEFPYRAIPVFLSRVFRHSGIYVRTDAGIKEPADLKGRVAGVPEYQMTAAVWIRGILQSEYGVAPSDMTWVNGGLEQTGRIEKTPMALPDNLSLTPIGPDKTLSGMLESGEIEVLVSARAPSCFKRGSPNVTRLFPNFREAEKDYFRKTGVFPMMHVIGIRKSLVDAQPWLASNVFEAFIKAKEEAQDDLMEVGALKVMLPWVAQEAEETVALMGHDYWPYGVAENKAALDAFLQYHFEQGLSGKEKFKPEDIFVPSTLERSRM